MMMSFILNHYHWTKRRYRKWLNITEEEIAPETDGGENESIEDLSPGVPPSGQK
jgi:hypothetical protein